MQRTGQKTSFSKAVSWKTPCLLSMNRRLVKNYELSVIMMSVPSQTMCLKLRPVSPKVQMLFNPIRVQRSEKPQETRSSQLTIKGILPRASPLTLLRLRSLDLAHLS